MAFVLEANRVQCFEAVSVEFFRPAKEAPLRGVVGQVLGLVLVLDGISHPEEA